MNRIPWIDSDRIGLAVLGLRAPFTWAYSRLDPAGFASWPDSLEYFSLSSAQIQARLAASRGFTVALKLPFRCCAWLCPPRRKRLGASSSCCR